MPSYIPGLNIATSQNQYVCDDFTFGHMAPVPCPDDGLSYLDGDFWAVPVVDSGLFQGFTFYPGNAAQTVGPTVQSFQVVRISFVNSPKQIWVRGNSTQFEAACSACCGTTPPALPTTVPRVAPCQILCDQLSGTNYGGVWGIPNDLPATYTWYPYGYFNNVALATAPGVGFSSVAAMVSWMNSNWNSVGIWQVSADNNSLFVTEAPGNGTDVACIAIIGVNPSGVSPF